MEKGKTSILYYASKNDVPSFFSMSPHLKVPWSIGGNTRATFLELSKADSINSLTHMIPNCCTFLFSQKILPKFYMVILLGAQSQDKHTVKCIATYDSLPAHFHMCFSDLLTTLTCACHVHDFLSSQDKSCHRNPYLRTSVYQAQGFQLL